MNPSQLIEGATAARYLDAIGIRSSRPVVFVVDSRRASAWSDVWLAAHTLRAALPADRVPFVYMFVGKPEDYLAQRPTTLRPDTDPISGISPSEYNGISSLYFAALAPTYGQQPVALILASASPEFDHWTDTRPMDVAGPGVAVVRGPEPVGAVRGAPDPVPAPGWFYLAGLALGGLAVLAAAGAGWALALLGPWVGVVEVAGLAPAVGAAALLLGGVILDVLGLAVGGWEAFVIVGLVAVTGWVAAVTRRRGAVVSPP
jgi:hypothetical protein